MSNNPRYHGFQPFQHLNVGSLDQPRGFAPSMNFQFRPTIPALQSEQVAPLNSQNFQCVGRGGPMMNLGFPSQSYVPQPLQSMHHTLERPNQSNQMQHVPLGPPALISQPNMSLASGASLSRPYVQTPDISMSGFGGPRALYLPASSYEGLRAPTYVTGPNPHGQAQQRTSTSQATPMSSMMNPTFEQSKVVSFQPIPSGEIQTDWVEHTSADGRRFFFNKRSKQSTWEKPVELMTPFERADARTDWKEHSSPDGRKYFYNKVTKQSTWSIPEELKIAREQAEKVSGQGTHAGVIADASKVVSRSDTALTAAPAGLPSQTSATLSTSDASEKLVLTDDWRQAALVPGSSSPIENVERVQMIADKTSQLRDTAENNDPTATATKTSVATLVDMDKISAENSGASDEISAKNTDQGSGTGLNEMHMVGSGSIGSQLDEKRINPEHVPYINKLEAVDAFKSLLKSANVGSDWTWEQALREIINDRRYGALRTLGERKQAFNEFLVQTKRAEEEERVAKQKKLYANFKKMLEECVDLTPSTRWSKALTMFEDDERFKALDREKDRRNIFEDHVTELKEKERVKAIEERKRNITEYRRFLESCKFIKSNSQWRKVQDRLEVDERCSRLEKIDQIEIFQEYLRDLEREEEERKKIQKEELKKAERKNRDDFRGLIDEHIATGVLTAKTSWRDYLEKVRDLPVYSAIASNSSGATPKDLFEDTVEELLKQHHELKSHMKDILKLRKVTLSAGSTYDEFKVSISEDVSLSPIPDVKLKLVFDDLLERAKDKEEKDARKRTRHIEKLVDIFRSFKDISYTSSWEESKHLVEGSEKCRTIGDESFRRQTFEDYVSHLKEQSKRIKQNKVEKVSEALREERDKGKGNYRREKDRVRERDSGDPHKKSAAYNYNHDLTETHGQERRRSGRDSHNRHRERHTNPKENETDHFKESHKTGGGHKKSRQQRGSMLEAEDEGREKRRRKEEESEQTKAEKEEEEEELEDGECGRY